MTIIAPQPYTRLSKQCNMSVNSLAAMSASLTDLKAHKFDRYAPGDADVSFDIAYCGICHTVHLPRFFAPAPPPAHAGAGVCAARAPSRAPRVFALGRESRVLWGLGRTDARTAESRSPRGARQPLPRNLRRVRGGLTAVHIQTLRAAAQDVHFIQNMLGFCQYPLVPGHEVRPPRTPPHPPSAARA